MGDESSVVNTDDIGADGSTDAAETPVASLDEGGLFPTVELPGKAEESESSKGDVKTEANKDKGKGAEDPPETRENERIRELNDRLKTAEAKLAARPVEPIETKPEKKEDPDYKDMSQMDADDLREWQNEDPKGYAENILRQAEARALENLAAQTQEADVHKTFAQYGKENPNFTEMWNDGSIMAFMKQNPGHNAISAHIILTQDSKSKKAVEEAVKTAKEEWTKDLKTKRTNAGLGKATSSPNVNADAGDKSLHDPDKYGGKPAVLLNRYNKRVRDGMSSF